MENICTSYKCEKPAVVFGRLTYEDTEWVKKVQYCAEHVQTADIAAGRDGMVLHIDGEIEQ